ncbi:N-acyl homoserine lactonase family protein [Faecalispora jeddahensis]|uniref:N-acyl homoserine lactonase family protein n=1 Tax=Faecalispora jeddahensis TaxID=1414721 RepID=UPI001899444C|nr:N-acyl homoserine lactonase family protein [Faecalispora jeddahensis]
MNRYSIQILEYANTDSAPVSGQIASAHNGGFMNLTMSYQLIEGNGHKILVDCGVNYEEPASKAICEAYAFQNTKMPKEVLARVGLTPEDIDTVIVTHGHFDHMGGLKLFPNAHFYIQKDELLNSLAALSLPKKFNRAKNAFLPCDIKTACEYVCDGRMTLLDGDQQIFDGIRVVALPMGHSYCGQIILVEVEEDGRKVEKILSGDVAYVQENVLGLNNDGVYVPFTAVGSPVTVVEHIDKAYALAGYDIKNLIFNHEVRNYKTYESVTYEDGLHVATVVR